MSSSTPLKDAKGNPIEGRVEHIAIKWKGEFLAGGVSSIVERVSSDAVVKSPWPGLREAYCRRDLTIEAAIYNKLPSHPRLVKLIHWDPNNCVLMLEYMPNGNLGAYMSAHNNTITMPQRLRWMKEAAEGLQLLHSTEVMHCDVEPKNFLLDASLGLRITDFGGSSLGGSRATACPGTRFEPPNFDWTSPQTIKDDLFSLGSTMYNILTGERPYQEIPSDEVRRRYQAHAFPDVSKIPCGEVIEWCWRGEIRSAQDIVNYMSKVIQNSCD
ncbi:kinase-like protein [Byssothecium circinans]|uniref:Kinase-like protein n=1 Tax=Byssothecium circinans TaxID=147558 RepID=A0A6A5TI25_9PLEO|nr:kinase-like protein [Byssothecium circinans]